MPTFRSEHDDLIRRLREKSKLFDRGTAERPEVWFLLREAADALEAAQRPPVSPEVREEMARVVREATAEYFREDLPEDGRDETDTIVDALLARFSVPSQPVYDEEKIARFTADALREDGEGFGSCDFPRDFAAALVAALRGGELTREERNRG